MLSRTGLASFCTLALALLSTRANAGDEVVGAARSATPESPELERAGPRGGGALSKDSASPSFSLHAQTGLGFGRGLTVRAGADGQYWLSSSWGLGGEVATVGQLRVFTALSMDHVAPLIAYRNEGGDSSWLFTAGAGYSYSKHNYATLCYDDPCSPSIRLSGHGYVLTGAAGYVHRGRLFEIGPTLRFDFYNPLVAGSDAPGLPDPQLIGTLNLLVGFGG